MEYIQEVETKIEKKTDEEMVPPQFYAYLDVFKKAPSERMSVRKPWDHAIDLNPNFVSRKSKLYPMSPTEQQKVRDFVDDQLKKGYIRPTKSPDIPGVFYPQERWKEMNGTRLSLPEQRNDQEQLSATTHSGTH